MGQPTIEAVSEVDEVERRAVVDDLSDDLTDDLLDEELLIEEVSIDGMCGVY